MCVLQCECHPVAGVGCVVASVALWCPSQRQLSCQSRCSRVAAGPAPCHMALQQHASCLAELPTGSPHIALPRHCSCVRNLGPSLTCPARQPTLPCPIGPPHYPTCGRLVSWSLGRAVRGTARHPRRHGMDRPSATPRAHPPKRAPAPQLTRLTRRSAPQSAPAHRRQRQCETAMARCSGCLRWSPGHGPRRKPRS